MATCPRREIIIFVSAGSVLIKLNIAELRLTAIEFNEFCYESVIRIVLIVICRTGSVIVIANIICAERFNVIEESIIALNGDVQRIARHAQARADHHTALD